jgi:hypothetical protein
MRMPDGVVHIPDYEADQRAFADALSRLPWETVNQAVELIVHPAMSQDALFHTRPERRIREYHLFTDPRLVKCLDHNGVAAVGFEALHNDD